MTKPNYARLIREKIEADFETEKWGIAAHEALAAVLREKWDGKKLNKRVADQFAERFMPDPETRKKAVVYWRREFGMTQIMVWGIGPWPNHEKRLSMYVAYDTNPTDPRLDGCWIECYKASSFEEMDSCHGQPAKDRQADRLKLLHGDAIDCIADDLESIGLAANALNTLIAHEMPGAQVRYFVQDLLKKAVSLD